MEHISAPVIWTPDPSANSFRQFYSDSDVLSAYFPTAPLTSLGGAVNMTTTAFDHCLAVNTNSLTNLVWISPPCEGDTEYYAELAYWIAGDQLSKDRYFVIALPWTSAIWHTEWMLDLQHQNSGITYSNIHLEAYDASMRDCRSLGIMHNMSAKALAPLLRRIKSDRQIKKVRDPTDEYPISFCDNVYTFCADIIRSQHLGLKDEWPTQSPIQSYFMDDILEDLTEPDLHLLTSCLTDEVNQGCGHQVKAIEDFSLLSILRVTDKNY
jgi:hypothetical protein